MIAMFLAATFGMMALLSVPLSIPPLDRIFAPPVVQVPGGAEAAGPSLPLPSWGHSQAIAAPDLAGQARAASAPSVTATHPGPSEETPGPPTKGPAPRLVLLRRLAGEIANSASPRLKALIRTGRVDGRDILRRTAIRLLHGHSPKDPRGSVGLGQIVTPPVGHIGTSHTKGLGHGHDQGRHHRHGHGRGDASMHGPGHDVR
jgi:hypothetical protein